jgi:type III secretion system (T3SS) SseB-like protein
MWSWLSRLFKTKHPRRREPVIRFLCEQDGIPERELKSAIVVKLREFAIVRKAYLARVDYGNCEQYNVALCLSSPEDRQIVDAVGKVFHEMWRSDQYLDILFLSPEQEYLLGTVCKPFYVECQSV